MDWIHRPFIKNLFCFFPFILVTCTSGSLDIKGNTDNDDLFMAKYGQYFRTEKEQAEIMKKFAKIFTKPSIQRKITVPLGQSSCSIDGRTAFLEKISKMKTCSKITSATIDIGATTQTMTKTTTMTTTTTTTMTVTVGMGGRRSHGCCISEPYDASPETAHDLDLNEVRLYVHKGVKQYFQTETCQRTPITPCPQRVCSDCRCELQMNKFKALIYDSNRRPKESLVLIPGSCKCLS